MIFVGGKLGIVITIIFLIFYFGFKILGIETNADYMDSDWSYRELKNPVDNKTKYEVYKYFYDIDKNYKVLPTFTCDENKGIELTFSIFSGKKDSVGPSFDAGQFDNGKMVIKSIYNCIKI